MSNGEEEALVLHQVNQQGNNIREEENGGYGDSTPVVWGRPNLCPLPNFSDS
ncbi:hypothetical protein D4764_01G0016060 [Takifugu flavidus]|uniref:Uncharacterized protein n=1 Tax=Takifugu flavidus TaxID=433684 RepID=A0A5C6PSP6_9TELE|nr:hypothetical protein D4764_01G0016060 [Takifugu flavidus]